MPRSEESPSHDDQVNEAIAAYLEAAERGEAPDREKFLAQHAEIAHELKSFLVNQAQFCEEAGDVFESRLQAAPGTNTSATAGTPAAPEGAAPTIPDEPTRTMQQSGVPSRKDVLRYFGEYELLQEIARGGMGVVYRARQVRLNRIVAVKMILSGQLASPEDVERFHTEAEAAAKLDHPGIVPIYEVGQHEGQHYFSMGFVDGQSLSTRVAQGPLPTREAAEIVRTVANAVQYAHENGVVHRDLKPGNVLLDLHGKPRITDFGLAKLTESHSDLTGTGQILGTPGYMPPEQAAAQASAVGHLSDIYSLGAILYCLLTGRPPFQAASPVETLLQVQKQEPVPPRQLNPAIPLDLDTIILKCLDKAPVRRYASAREMAEELQRYLDGRPIVARPIRRFERFWRWCRREPVIASLSAAVAAALIAGTIISSYYGVQASSRAAEKAKLADEKGKLAENNAALAKSERTARVRQTQLADEKAELAEKETQARRTAENQTRLAIDRLEKIRRTNYVARLALVSAKLDSDPSACLILLEDEEVCPVESRDFVWRLYHRLARRDQVSWPAHTKKITFLAFVPRLSAICSASLDGSLKLWRQIDRRVLNELKSTVPITCGIRLPDGETVATGDANGTVTFWKLPECTRRSFPLFDGPIFDIAAAADGSLIAACSGNGVVVCDFAQGTVVRRHNVNDSSLWSIAFSPDDRMLIAVGAERNSIDGCIRVYSGNQFSAVLHAPPSRLGALTDVIVRGTSNSLLLLTAMGHVRTFDLETYTYDDKPLPTIATGLALAATEDGKVFATSTTYGYVVSADHPAKRPRLLDSQSFKHTIRQSADDSKFQRVHLWKADGLEVASHLVDVGEDVTSLSFSSDQRLLATGSNQGEITLYDVSPNRERATLAAGHQARHLRFTDDGEYLSSYEKDKIATWHLSSLTVSDHADDQTPPPTTDQSEVHVDYDRPEKEKEVSGIRLRFDDQEPTHSTSLNDSGGVYSISVGPGGKWAAARRSVLGRAVIDIWDAQTGEKWFSFPVPDAAFSHVLWINSAQFVDVGSKEKESGLVISQLDIENRAGVSREFAIAGRSSAPPLLSPDRRIVAISQGHEVPMYNRKPSGEIVLWDVESSRERAHLVGHRAGIWSLAYSPDSRVLATGSFDHSIKLWDTLTGAEMATLTGHRSTVTSLAFSPDGKTLASGSIDKTIKLWAAPELDERLPPRALFGLDAEPFAGDKSADRPSGWGRSFAELLRQAMKNFERATLADAIEAAPAARRLPVSRPLEGHTATIWGVAFPPDGELIASASEDCSVKLWNWKRGTLKQSLDGHTSLVRAVAFAADGKMLASGSFDKTVRLWDPTTGKLLGMLEDTAPVYFPVFMKDGKTLVTSSADNSARVWDLSERKLIRQLEGHTATAWVVAVSSDSKLIATGGHDLSIILWNAVDGTRVRTLTGHAQSVESLAFSPDVRILASSGGQDKTARLWDPTTGELLHTLDGHGDTVHAVAFSPDGASLATACRDRVVRLWDTPSGKLLRSFEGGGLCVAFSPDGKRLASGGEDKLVYIWDIPAARKNDP